MKSSFQNSKGKIEQDGNLNTFLGSKFSQSRSILPLFWQIFLRSLKFAKDFFPTIFKKIDFPLTFFNFIPFFQILPQHISLYFPRKTPFHNFPFTPSTSLDLLHSQFSIFLMISSHHTGNFLYRNFRSKSLYIPSLA